jgi:hypothetical protein
MGLRRLQHLASHLTAGPKTGGGAFMDANTEANAGCEGRLGRADEKIPLVGDVTMFAEDYIAGLKTMISNLHPESRLGYYDNMQTDVVIVLKPQHVSDVLDASVEHALHGLKPASEAFFGKKVLFVLHGQEWQQLRRVMRPAFMTSNLDTMTDDTAAKAQAWGTILEPYADSGRAVDVLMAASMYHLSSVSIAAFHFDLGCIERFEDGPNAVNQSFELMLSELPRRAFSPDPALQNDFETDNEDNRVWNHAASTVRGVVTTMVTSRLAAMKAGEVVPGDLLDDMVPAHRLARSLAISPSLALDHCLARSQLAAATSDHDPPPHTHHVLLSPQVQSYRVEFPQASLSLEAEASTVVRELGDNLIEILFAG